MNPVGVTFLWNGSIAQLNRASDYGSEGYRFESCWSHKKVCRKKTRTFFFVHAFLYICNRYKVLIGYFLLNIG